MKIHTVRQRLLLYKKAHKMYELRKPNFSSRFLCNFFYEIGANIDFRKLKEVVELCRPSQIKSEIMFVPFIIISDDRAFEIRNKFLKKLIKHTENKIKKSKNENTKHLQSSK